MTDFFGRKLGVGFQVTPNSTPKWFSGNGRQTTSWLKY